MCYHCLKKMLLETSEKALGESGSADASQELLDGYESLIDALRSSSDWSASDGTAQGHTNPLTFSYAVVAKQMKQEWAQAPTTPRQMTAFLRQVVKRMLSVEDINPYGKAVLGVDVMPAVIKSLANQLDGVDKQV